MKSRISLVSFMLFACAPSMASDWSSAPLLTAEKCDSLTYDNVTGFLNTYYYPTLGWSAGQKDPEIGMMSAYAISSTLLTKSQVCLSEALGLKELTDQLKVEQAVLSSGTSLSEQEMKKHRTMSAEADKKIQEAANASATLQPEKRKTFGLGTATYLAGTYAMTELGKEIGNYLDAKKDAPAALNTSNFGLASMKLMMEGAKTLNTVRKVGSGVTGLLSSSVETGKTLVEYAKKNDVAVPADATSKLGW